MDQRKRDPLPLDGEVAAERFIALSPGIGLGEPRVKPVREDTPSRLVAKDTASIQSLLSPSTSLQPPTAGAASFPPDRQPRIAQSSQGRLRRLLFAYSFDFVMVCVTLATGLMSAAVWQSVETGVDLSSDWSAVAPVQWLAGFEVYEVVLGVYAIFLAYAILFKWIVGFTLGESVLRLVPKASGDDNS